MTRLLNLESYLELCCYAHLFDGNVENLVPERDSLPYEYKKILQKHKDTGSFPNLRVIDRDGKHLRSFLAEVQESLQYNHIPPQQIDLTRRRESEDQLRRLNLDLDTIRSSLMEISRLLSYGNKNHAMEDLDI